MLRRRNLKRSLAKAAFAPGYALSVLNKRLKSYLAYRFLNG